MLGKSLFLQHLQAITEKEHHHRHQVQSQEDSCLQEEDGSDGHGSKRKPSAIQIFHLSGHFVKKRQLAKLVSHVMRFEHDYNCLQVYGFVNCYCIKRSISCQQHTNTCPHRIHAFHCENSHLLPR